MAAEKTCSQCKRELPLTKVFFGGYISRRRNKAQWAWRSYCKECSKIVNKKFNDLRWTRHRDKLLARVREDRRLNPDKYKEYDSRNWINNREQKRQYKKRLWAECDKEEKREKLKAWQRENPDKVRATWERTYQKHKAKHSARVLRWNKQNPEAVAAIRDRRRAREFGALGSYTKEDIRELIRLSGRSCFYCGSFLKKFHADHFIPLSRGGSNWPSNIRLSCPSCNYSKAERMPWEWMPDRFQKDTA